MRGVFVAMLVLACGGGGAHHLADGAPDSPFQDAPKPDAAPEGLVTVTVTLQGSAVLGAAVYFQNADSSIVVETGTNLGGIASASMKAGGFVTVLEPLGNGLFTGSAGGRIATFAGVKPGDNLFDDVQPVTPSPNGIDITLIAPIDTLGGSAVSTYQMFASCGGVTELQGPSPTAAGSNLPPSDVTLVGCNGSADMIVGTFDVNGQPIDSFFVGGVPVMDGSNVTVTGTYVPVVSPQTFNFTDVPGEVSQINLAESIGTARGPMFGASTFGFTNTTGSGTATLPTPSRDPAVTAFYDYTLFPAGTVRDQQDLVSVSKQPSSIDVDVGAIKLRSWLTTAQLDPVNQQLGWVVAATGVVPDYVIGDVGASRNISNTIVQWEWRLVSPADSDGAMQFPTLPTDLFDFSFHDTDSTFVNQLFGLVSPGGYDAARAGAIDAVSNGLLNDALPFALATGNVSIQRLPSEVALRRPSRAPTNQRPRARATVLDGRHALRTAR